MAEEIKRESITPTVTLTEMQYDLVQALVSDNNPEQWTLRRYMSQMVMSVGYAPSSTFRLMNRQTVMTAATYLLNKRPINIIVRPNEGSVGSPGRIASDPDALRKPGEPLNSYRQEMFCQEIVADPYRNTKKAARRAGYEGKGDYGWDLLQMPKIKTRIEEIQKDRVERLKADQDDVLRKLLILSHTNLADYIKRFDGNKVEFEDFSDISRDILYGLVEIRHKQTEIGVGQNKRKINSMNIKVTDKTKVLALLAKHFGLLDTLQSLDPTEYAAKVREIAKSIGEAVPGGEV